MKSRFPHAFTASFLLTIPSALAVPFYWDGADLSSWGLSTNWALDAAGATDPGVGVIPGAADTVNFNITGLNAARSINLDANQAALGINVTSTGAVSLLGGGTARTLSLGTGGITAGAGVTALNIGSTTAGQEVNLSLMGSQLWTYGGANTGTNGIFVRNSVSLGVTGSHTLTLGGSVGNPSASNISGVISDGGADRVLNLTLAGANSNSRWNLQAANTYTGVTTISVGGLGISNSNALGATGAASGTSVASGASLFLRAGVTVGESLSIAGTGIANLGALRAVGGTSTWNGAISANATSGDVAIGADINTNLTLSSSADITTTGSNALRFTSNGADSNSVMTVNGNISGSVSVLKTGITTSFLTFGGDAKTYSGATTVSVGTLTLNTALTNSSGLTVASGAVLRGNNGSLGNASASTSISGTLRPGAADGTIGALSLGNGLTFTNTGRFEVDLRSSDLTSDVVTITGNLNIDNTNAAILAATDIGGAPITTGAILVLKYSGVWNGGLFTVDGTVITDNGNTFTVGGNTYQIDYDYVDGAGRAVALIATVPEPATFALAAGGVAALGLRRRRKD